MNPEDIQALLARRSGLRALGYGAVPQLIKIQPSEKIQKQPLVYHYTSIEAFEKIVSSRQLWASEYRKLNDLSEIYFAVDFVLDLILRQEWVETDKKKAKDFFINDVLPKLDDNIFIASFSLRGHLLSQWRAYAMPDGVAFGVPLETLQLKAVSMGMICAPVFMKLGCKRRLCCL